MNQFTSFKNLFLAAAFLLFFANFSLAQLSADTETLPQKHLEEINAQWMYHSNALPEQTTVEFDTDLDRIQYHLYLVIAHLRQNSPKGLSDKALENRNHLLDILESYADAKVFPTNLYHSKRTPYFIDDYGVHCAVGYLIQQSGHEDLAQTIRKEHNYDYLADIKTAGISEWANEFGFTMEELKWIQPGYAAFPIIVEVLKADDGVIRGSIVDETNDALISFGSFRSINNNPMEGIVVTKNNQTTAFSGSFQGDIYDCFGTLDDLFACGRLINGKDTMEIGHFKNGTWEYFKSPNLDYNIVTKIIRTSENEVMLNLTNSDTSMSDGEFWSWDLSKNIFTKRIEYYGIVHTLSNTNFGTLFPGTFTGVNDVVNPSSTLKDSSSLVLRYNSSEFSNFVKKGAIMEEVTSLNALDSVIYLGFKTRYLKAVGDFSFVPQLGFFNPYKKEVKTLLTRQDALGSPKDHEDQPDFIINDLSLFEDELLVFGGSFIWSDLMFRSENLMGYNLDDKSLFKSVSRQVILSLDYLSDSLIYMTHPTSITQMRHPVSVPRVVQNQSLSVYPNPFNTSLTIEGLFSASPYKLRDVSGKIVQEGIIDGQDLTIEENVTPGVYTLTIETSGRTETMKLIKQ